MPLSDLPSVARLHARDADLSWIVVVPLRLRRAVDWWWGGLKRSYGSSETTHVPINELAIGQLSHFISLPLVIHLRLGKWECS
jgi:hypothetical protein